MGAVVGWVATACTNSCGVFLFFFSSIVVATEVFFRLEAGSKLAERRNKFGPVFFRHALVDRLRRAAAVCRQAMALCIGEFIGRQSNQGFRSKVLCMRIAPMDGRSQLVPIGLIPEYLRAFRGLFLLFCLYRQEFASRADTGDGGRISAFLDLLIRLFFNFAA
ncbi:hypothetical protein ACFS07_33450 [Undibacterium arcticum]